MYKFQPRAKKGIFEVVSVSVSLYRHDGIKYYNYATAESTNDKIAGQFTQLVWKETTRFGLGIATRPSKKTAGNVETFIVAKYQTPGEFFVSSFYPAFFKFFTLEFLFYLMR